MGKNLGAKIRYIGGAVLTIHSGGGGTHFLSLLLSDLKSVDVNNLKDQVLENQREIGQKNKRAL